LLVKYRYGRDDVSTGAGVGKRRSAEFTGANAESCDDVELLGGFHIVTLTPAPELNSTGETASWLADVMIVKYAFVNSTLGPSIICTRVICEFAGLS
jgi:hypothetical protein